MSAAAETINVSEKLDKIKVGKYEGQVHANAANNLFAPDTDIEVYSNGHVNGEKIFEDQRVCFQYFLI